MTPRHVMTRFWKRVLLFKKWKRQQRAITAVSGITLDKLNFREATQASGIYIDSLLIQKWCCGS